MSTAAPLDLDSLLAPGARSLAALRARAAAGAAPARPAGLPPVRVDLSNNESVFGPSPAVAEALRGALAASGPIPPVARYPSGLPLRRRIGEALGVPADMIALGNGSNEILQLIAATLLSPEVEVVCPRLSYAMFAMLGTLSGATLRYTAPKGWGYDLEAIRAAINPRTRLVFLANPNNPTGTLLGSSALEAFLREVPTHVVVVLDEAYRDYASDLPDAPDGVRWLAAHRNLVVTRTFSKAHGLAGLRVGYAVADAALVTALQSSGQPNNVNWPAMVAAEAALADTQHVARVRADNRAALARMCARLEALGVRCQPSHTNFVLAHAGAHGPALLRHLAAQGIAVGSLAMYGVADHLRITVGTAAEVDALAAAWAAFQPPAA